MDEVDRGTVEQLFADYAAVIDEDMDILDQVFVDNAQWTSVRPGADNVVIVGRSQINELLAKSARAPGQRRHAVSNLRLAPAGDGVTVADAYLTFSLTKDNVFGPVTTGTYRAEVVKDGGEWRFRTLLLTLDFSPA